MAPIWILLRFTNFSATNNASMIFQSSQNVQFSFFCPKCIPTIEVPFPTDTYQFGIEPPCDLYLLLLHIVLAWRLWAWKGPSALHSPPGRWLSISVPLNAHGEAGQPWDQERHENAGVGILTLSQASFQALPICASLHMLLAAPFSMIPPLVFPSHFHLVLLLH